MSPTRTAVVERDDVLAFLAEQLKTHRKAEREADREENRGAKLERLRSKIGLLETLSAYITRGDHEGAVDR